MRLRPLNDNIILEPDPMEEFHGLDDKSQEILKSGLIAAPDIAKEKLRKVSPMGTVLSWGSQCKYPYKAGDRVYYRQFSGTPLKFEDKEYRIITEWDLIAKLET